ncbi:PREDICTED: tyrosine-protein kinase Fer-like isoform X3 [Acropora digitifera]|uniref:tyrosine-protein kinase Fer-like isoform X3 n=1 Tax=Acropora digitifera TaxID=70779 RepID=UPI000779FF06|nr:PREDICTED: tyrosine-protein kinase Fer-like isoform X3 [Acropora digitifera]
MHMAADKKDPRLLLSKELEAIRSKIVREELVLFVGEQLSTLVTQENQSPSLDDWWQIVNHPSEDRFKALLDLEEGFLARHQLAQSRVHNVLRNVGKFPLMITTNMDELLEKFLWKTGNGGEKIRLDQISCLAKSWPYLRRDVVIKCLGDAGFNARVLPSSKKYFEDFCDSQENAEVEFTRQLFNERSILFLGCDPNRVEYMNFFRKFAVNAKEMKHYKFETHSESALEENGNLLTLKANLQPWEFVQFLSTGNIEEKIQPGRVYERSYLRLQRAEYLQQQLALEKMASEIVFHTISITNALSPDEFFEQVSLPTIQNIFTQDPFGVYSKEKVERTMDAMKARRDNLIELIRESKTNVTALFFYHGVKNEIELWKKEAKSEEEKQKNLKKCKISISKYAKAILLCKSFLRNKSSLEMRIVGDQDTYKVQEVERETFALIRLKGGQDEAICYAETATSPQSRKFANHLININGEEVLNKRRIYEKSRANAWSNEDSIFKLANALLKENDEIQKQGFGVSAIDKDDLEKLATLARVSLKVRSQLDLDSFERLAAGSFGEVFKAERKGNPVAVKILKNVENVKQIEYYEREVDLLSKAKHPNIVGVIGCLAIDNNLAIVMELVLGGNLKQFLKKDLKAAEKKEFTVRFVEHIGSAIEHLHSLDIIHRDVKPDNILLSEDHKVLKLGDFGIARATEGTEQTKTMMGSYRYMAPEVGMALRCHYSKRADVYSFGLCLIEVLSQGKVVFAHIADDEAVMDRKKHGEKPHIPEISVDEFGEELATKLKGITEECLRPESSRPEMSRVLRMLRGELTANKGTVELYCIGTGTGTTAVVHGQPSSSVIIYHDGKPLLLADIGAGVLKPCMEKLGHSHSSFPRNVFISHNHMDHSGELPLLLAFESMRRYKAKEPALRVLCGPEVEHKLKAHRLDELLSTSYTPEQVAEWIVCKPDGDPTYLDDAKQFFIKIYRTLHSEVCYGFLLHFKDKPILGYLVDSGFNEDVYEFFFQASTVVVDARENGNEDHASFAEVVDYVKKHEFKRSKVYITGYGIDNEYPQEGLPEVEPLRPEQYITLWEEDMENAKH